MISLPPMRPEPGLYNRYFLYHIEHSNGGEVLVVIRKQVQLLEVSIPQMQSNMLLATFDYSKFLKLGAYLSLLYLLQTSYSLAQAPIRASYSNLVFTYGKRLSI